ncbi:MAG: hypothetical protein IPK88_12130 [Saprospiraceae bacterium]|nr:hypothetical protein [Candidatus Defluviibacterium haderslevense]
MKFLSNNIINIYVYFIISASMVLIQCRKDIDTTDQNTSIPLLVSGGVYGVVTNELGVPESEVSVSHNGTTIKSDKNGIFILKDQLLNKAGAQIKFEKKGYYIINKSVIPIKDKLVSTRVQLVPRKVIKVINSNTGGIVATNGTAQVSFQPSSIIDAAGNIYNGIVNVYAYWMDPSKESTFMEMPGNLTGRDLKGKEVILQTLGMMAVELEDPAGNQLNIAKDKTAELKIPIPASLDSKAKTTIPMWYYDATKGGWIEEGISTRVGQFYVANVAHFTFWNWDFSFPSVSLKFRIVDLLNKPIGQVNLNVVDDLTGQHGSGATNLDGTFEGKIPVSSNFTLTVSDPNCFIPLTYKFSSGTSDINLGDINLNITSKHIFGKIVDCNKMFIANGYVQIWFVNSKYNLFFPIDATGTFDFNVANCSLDDLNYKVVDIDHQKESPNGIILSQGPNENDLGNVLACNELESYFILNVDGKLDDQRYYVIQKNYDSNKRIVIIGESPDSTFNDTLLIDIPLFSTGAASPTIFHYFGGKNGNIFYCKANCQSINATITEFGNIGQSIKGNFLGQIVNNKNSKLVNIDGSFKVKREY